MKSDPGSMKLLIGFQSLVFLPKNGWSQILKPDFVPKCFNLHIRNLGNTDITGHL